MPVTDVIRPVKDGGEGADSAPTALSLGIVTDEDKLPHPPLPSPRPAAATTTEAAPPTPCGAVGRRHSGSLKTWSHGPSLTTVSRRHRQLGTDLLPSLATRSTTTFRGPTAGTEGHSGGGGPVTRARRQSADAGDPFALRSVVDRQHSVPRGTHQLAAGGGLRRVVEDVELGGGGGGRAHPPPAGPDTGALAATAGTGGVAAQSSAMESVSEPHSELVHLTPSQHAVDDLASASIRRAEGPTYNLPTNEAAETYTSMSRLRGVGLYYTGMHMCSAAHVYRCTCRKSLMLPPSLPAQRAPTASRP